MTTVRSERLQMLVLVVLLGLVQYISAAGPVTQDLSTASWQLANAQGTISVPASVPGQVHLDLLAAGKIEDPYKK